jgi:hypothetical protein
MPLSALGRLEVGIWPLLLGQKPAAVVGRELSIRVIHRLAKPLVQISASLSAAD